MTTQLNQNYTFSKDEQNRSAERGLAKAAAKIDEHPRTISQTRT
jgi:hypothetical protein